MPIAALPQDDPIKALLLKGLDKYSDFVNNPNVAGALDAYDQATKGLPPQLAPLGLGDDVLRAPIALGMLLNKRTVKAFDKKLLKGIEKWRSLFGKAVEGSLDAPSRQEREFAQQLAKVAEPLAEAAAFFETRRPVLSRRTKLKAAFNAGPDVSGQYAQGSNKIGVGIPHFASPRNTSKSYTDQVANMIDTITHEATHYAQDARGYTRGLKGKLANGLYDLLKIGYGATEAPMPKAAKEFIKDNVLYPLYRAHPWEKTAWKQGGAAADEYRRYLELLDQALLEGTSKLPVIELPAQAMNPAAELLQKYTPPGGSR